MFQSLRRLLEELSNHPPSGQRPRTRLAIEALEDRWVPSTIGGSVYDDSNGNGIRDNVTTGGGAATLESGYGSIPIQLRDATGTVVLDTTTTDATGHYSFSFNKSVTAPPATKVFEADLPLINTDSTRTVSLTKFDASLGTLTSVDIIADSSLTTQATIENLGNAPTHVSAEIDGTVTFQGPGGATLTETQQGMLGGDVAAFDGNADLKGTDTYDSGQQQLAAQEKTITLTAGQQDLSGFTGTGTVDLTANASATTQSVSGPGNLLAMVHTGSSAHVKIVYHYTPGTPLAPGQYVVVKGATPPGTTDGLETNDNITPIPGSQGQNQIAVNLGTTDSLQNNFAELTPTSLMGIVYQDVTGSGSYTPGNLPIANVTITLTGTNGVGTPVHQVTQTIGDGTYQFLGLLPGQYQITETQPAGYLEGTNNIGTSGGTVSGDTFTVPLTSTPGSYYDFGEIKPTTPPPDVFPPPPQVVTPPPLIVTPPPEVVTPPSTPPTFGLPSKFFLTGSGWGGWGW